MRIPATLTRLAFVTLGSTALVAAAPSVRFDDGYLVMMKVTSDQAPTSITFKVAGEKVRIETDMASMMGGGGGGGGGGGMGAMAQGAFMLPQPGGKLAVIIPNSPMGPMGIVIDGAVIGGGGGGRGRGMAPPAGDMTEISVTVDDMGGGESIIGHSTHKYKLHRKFTQAGAPHDETEELWMSTDFPGAEKAFTKVGSMFGQNGGELADAVLAKMPKGVPLKIVSTRGTSVSTAEVTEVTKSTFEAAEFEIPAGVQLMDLNAMMGGRGRGGRQP